MGTRADDIETQKRFKAAGIRRRDWLKAVLFGSGLLGLRAIASGIPVEVLANPRRSLLALDAEAVQSKLSAARAQFLVMAASDSGEPINCNAPGMYDDPKILHPSDGTMAPTSMRLGDTTTKAAAVWANLPDAVRAQSCFFHYRTNSIAHGEFRAVHTLHGAVPKQESVLSALSGLLYEPLGTMQKQPVVIGVGNGAVGVSMGGVEQPIFTPTSIKAFLTAPAALDSLNKLTSLRDDTLNQFNSMLAQSGTTSQKRLLEAWATSQQQARQLSAGLLTQLAAITDNTVASQMKCAALLCSLKLSPAVILYMPFGGDNHADVDPHYGKGLLPAEQADHVASLAAISGFLDLLKTTGLSSKVTFTTLSTFGRTNPLGTYHGRTHNASHTVSLMVGANVKGSVVGGAALKGLNLFAKGIDSTSGQAVDGGDIADIDSLNAYAATLASACGVDDASIQASVSPGKVVRAAVA